nr:phage tape measure protein [uncultured Mediterranean phage uvMED]
MAADSVVRLLVDARNALSGLRQTNKESKKLERAFTALSAEAKKVKSAAEAQNAGFVKLSQVQGVFSAKVRNTEVAIRAQIKALRDIQSRVELGGTTYQRAAKQIEAYEKQLNEATRASNRATNSNKKLSRSVRSLSGFVGKAALAFAAFKAAQAGVNRAESERRLKLLGESYGEVAQLENLAAQNAQKFNLSQTEANQAIADVFARLRPLGVSLEDINSTFAGFRTAAVLGGATAQEASAAFTQLSQALGSGALRGDEFRSVSEQAPLVLQAIADETGLAAGQLKEYAAEGLLTSDIVIKALKRIESEGADKLKEALGGPAAAIKEFQNAAEDVAVAVTESIIPGLAEGFKDLAQIIRDLEGPIKFVGGLLGGLLDAIQGVTGRLSRGFGGAGIDFLAQKAAADRTGTNAGPAFDRALAEEKLIIAARQRRIGAGIANLPASAANIPGAAKPKGTSPLGPLKDKKTGKSDAEKEADRLKRLAESADKRVQSLKDQALLASALTKEEQAQFQLSIDIRKALEDNAELGEEAQRREVAARLALEDKRLEAIRFNAVREEGEKAEKEAEDRREKAAKKLEEQQKQAAQKIAERYKAIGDSIQSGIVEGLRAAVDGTKSLAEVASNTLNNIANQLLKMGVNMGLSALGGSLGGPFAKLFPGKARGGTVTGGRSYLVGERGPELFTPGRTGSIAPNNAMGGSSSIVVNVDATGSTVQGDAGEAKQLGDAIGVAIRQELLKQKRPGGLLA